MCGNVPEDSSTAVSMVTGSTIASVCVCFISILISISGSSVVECGQSHWRRWCRVMIHQLHVRGQHPQPTMSAGAVTLSSRICCDPSRSCCRGAGGYWAQCCIWLHTLHHQGPFTKSGKNQKKGYLHPESQEIFSLKCLCVIL